MWLDDGGSTVIVKVLAGNEDVEDGRKKERR